MTVQKIGTLLAISYYLTIATVVSFKVVETVFSGSILVGKGSKVAELKAQKHDLLQEMQLLNEQLAQAESLSQLDESQIASFNAISNPIVLEVPSTVASR
jgi:hypothetical protein